VVGRVLQECTLHRYARVFEWREVQTWTRAGQRGGLGVVEWASYRAHAMRFRHMIHITPGISSNSLLITRITVHNTPLPTSLHLYPTLSLSILGPPAPPCSPWLNFPYLCPLHNSLVAPDLRHGPEWTLEGSHALLERHQHAKRFALPSGIAIPRSNRIFVLGIWSQVAPLRKSWLSGKLSPHFHPCITPLLYAQMSRCLSGRDYTIFNPC
jgi:hypothetical protein